MIKSINPATLDIIGKVETTPPEKVESIVQSAREGFEVWRQYPLKERAAVIKKAQQLLLDRSHEFAETITLEMGRPYAESLALEVVAAADIMGHYARHAKKYLNGHRVSLHNPFFKRRTSRFYFQPLGVMGIISPWNWPLLIPLGCIIPALLAGNAVVFKHSEFTPLLAVKIRELLSDAGVPEKTFQLIQGYGDVGRALVDSNIEKIFFTGSTNVGRLIMEQASKDLKKTVLELGGNDPAIVCKDADLEITASGILWGGFNNCGQNCNGIERVYVNKSIADSFIAKLVEKTKKLTVGNGMEENTDIGPLASEAQLNKIKKIVTQFREMGGQILTGGNPIDAEKGYYFEPTVILMEKSIPFDTGLEIFGPVILVTSVDDDAEAVRLANRSDFGLSASVWTRNRKRGQEIARQLQAGSVMINDSVVAFGMPEADWTGVKKSGIGWVHGEKGLYEMVNIMHINDDALNKTQNFWWFPYSRSMIHAMRAGLQFLFSSRLINRIKALPAILKNFTSYLLSNRPKQDKF